MAKVKGWGGKTIEMLVADKPNHRPAPGPRRKQSKRPNPGSENKENLISLGIRRRERRE